MMMTCRLLCVLLVLALCCCPSVCMTASDDKDDTETTIISTVIGPDATVISEPKIKANSQESAGLVEVTEQVLEEESDELQGLNTEVVALQSEKADSGPGKVSEKVPGPLQEQDAANAGKGVKKAHTEIKLNTMTNTTTTNAITTTTTAPETTTTTTTTQAPTTTTTRAPSRLREVDGSLSSSAWVCAPLLLAASALAYTTVG
ncbi:mucin TcMUCII [Trypanosoma cruzi cruzi]|uniref:Putative mucin TcMUCII n=1 Tax=Trypanosoma cruzi TaxID=5693 RepID=A0A2V2V7H4_TRYCR|nr:mucin TcMUCII [Trypanosoma cruzi cruzi]PWU92234.1 putative mucin TcMUCII [Trypanosoma cruzi]